MKIIRLDLLAFGPFTDHSLEFSRETGLHLVHGPNEAGKSSALRALRNWLYGIPPQTTDNFVHPHMNLRIGGLLEAADGTRHEFIRRKGRLKTLRGSDDDALFDESQLLSLLEGIDDQTFAQRFGIDYEELRRGGEAVVEGQGDLSEILFAAGAGVADLRTIQQRLEEEADALFKPRGSNQRIAQSLSELDKTRKQIRDTQLPTSQWVEHDRALRTAEKRQCELDEELTGKRTELSRLDRIRDSLPLIGRLKPLRAVLAAVANAPHLPETFTADRREAELKLTTAQGDEANARQEIERLQEDIRSVTVPLELVEHQTAITNLHTELGGHKKAAKDRPCLAAQRDSAQREATNRLKEITQPIPLAEADSLRLSKALRRKIQELAGECKALIESQRASQEDSQKLGERIERIQVEVNRLPPERSVSDLDRTIRLVQKSGNLDAQRLTVQTELESLSQKAHIALARLPLFQGTLDQLEKLPIPTVETIERFEKLLADADDNVRRCQERIDKLSTERLNLQGKLDALRLEREVPTEAELAAIRQRRDAGWQLILKVGLPVAGAQGGDTQEPAVAEFVAAFAPGGDLATAFQESFQHADDIADRLRREADRVAQQAQLTADVQQMDADLKISIEAREEAERRCEQRVQDWQSQWQPVGIEPHTPREMRSWRTPQQELVGIAAAIRQRQAELQLIQSQIDSHRAELNRCLTALELPATVPPFGTEGSSVLKKGTVPLNRIDLPKEIGSLERDSPLFQRPGRGGDLPLANFLEYCEETAASIRKQNQQRERQMSELEGLRGNFPEADRKAAAAEARLQEWRAAWAQAVATIGLDSDAKPTEANAVIETVDELLKAVDELRALEERIAGIDADAVKYEQAVRQLLEQVAADLIDTLKDSVERAVADLVDRLNRAVTDQTKVQSWQEQLQKQQVARDTATTRIKQAEQQLETLCRQAGCQSPAELPHAEERASQRRKADAEIQALEHRLCELAAGAALAVWIEQAEAMDSDRVPVDLAALHEAIATLEAEKQAVSESLGEHRNELNRMDGSGKAAEAQIEAEHLLASIRSDAEQYIRHRLASAVLARAMERFRQSSQGPVLSRASELFSMLTLNSFAGLRADYDDKGTAILVGVRTDGQTVQVSGMSEGTCDQIYLALRVAMIESSLTGREPLPFIVDDILAMYDDHRAGAALRILLQLSKKTQVILFTHHSHLVEIARKLPENEMLSVIGL